MTFDHPIFVQSIEFIKTQLGFTGLDSLQQEVLERLIHTSGDFELQSFLRFSPRSCQLGLRAIEAGAPILTDTAMASAAVAPMLARTLQLPLFNALEWAPIKADSSCTRTEIGMRRAWKDLSHQFVDSQSPIVLIGSSPTALEAIVNSAISNATAPSLIIGMPVGFIGVAESKSKLSKSSLPHIRLDGSRGGAALAAATINALLRASKLSTLTKFE